MSRVVDAVRRALGLSAQGAGGTASSTKLRVLVYKRHPITGENADDFPPDMTAERKEEIAAMFRHGARFYWYLPAHGNDFTTEGYERIEFMNFKFVVEAQGLDLVTVE